MFRLKTEVDSGKRVLTEKFIAKMFPFDADLDLIVVCKWLHSYDFKYFWLSSPPIKWWFTDVAKIFANEVTSLWTTPKE